MGSNDFKNKPHDEQTFLTEIGSKATVQRIVVPKEGAAKPNRALCDLGLECQPEHTTYMGSAAVHVYMNEILQQLFFVSQTDPLALYKCPEPLAAKAFDDLLGTMKQMYGHRRGRLRSGF